MRYGTWIRIVGAAALSTLLSCTSAPPAKAAPAPRAPMEDIKYASELRRSTPSWWHIRLALVK